VLSDSEQRRLAEIELGLQSEDPEFTERFGHALQRGAPRWRMTARGWLIAAALLAGLAVLTGNAAIVLLALSVAGVSAGLWLTGPGRSPDARPPLR
jgi:hypothetical protein